MARKARVKSSTGIYHVLVRAIADLSLFSDAEDTNFYIGILNDLQRQGRCEIYAYALFPTHVHLLIREGCNDAASGLRCEQGSTIQAEPYDDSHRSELALASRDRQGVPTGCEAQTNRNEVHRSEANRSETYRSETNRSASESSEPIGSIMKRIASAYSYYFNVKYDHYGPIYLDRFKSNPVESRPYFIRVLDHIKSQQTEDKFTCRHIPSGLETFHYMVEREPLLDFKSRPVRITESRLMTHLCENFGFTDIDEFLQRNQEEQDKIIASCKKVGGSIRQIVRLTGCPYAHVFNVRK